MRAATLRTLHATAAAAEARARTLAEQVLARVLKDGLTDPSQIPVRGWVVLDAARRQAIETRLDHNAAGTEPAPNPALVDELATQMTRAPSAFARRDLVPSIAHLPLPQWQRFRDLQAGVRRNDPATEDEIYAIKRGLQLAMKMLPTAVTHAGATNTRAALMEEIDTWRRVTGKSPDDDVIEEMVARTPSAGLRLFDRPGQDRPHVHRIQSKANNKPGVPVAVPPRSSLNDGTPPFEEKIRPIQIIPDLPPLGFPGRSSSTKPTPTTAAPKTTSAPSPAGKSSGQAIGDRLSGGTSRTSPGGDTPQSSTWSRNSPTRPPGTNEHHEIVQKSWNPIRETKPWWTFSKEARDYFDSKTITVKSSDHKYNAEHRAYNATVRTAIEKHLAGPPKVDPETMSLKGAKALYRAVMRNPDVRAFRKKMLESNERVRKQHPMWMDGQ